MLAPVLAVAQGLSVCLSVSVCVCHSQVRVLSKGIDGRIDLAFGMVASIDQSYTVL